MLQGLRTYIVVAVAILSALLGWFSDQLTWLQALQAIGIAVGVGGNRAVLNAGHTVTAIRTGADPAARMFVTYAGVALAVLTALLAGLNGEQDAAVTISTILGALGLNFLGLGAKKAVE